MILRLVDFLKSKGITAILTSLIHGPAIEQSEVAISSVVDTWLFLRHIEGGGERNRALYILKSRGMAHSNQIREYLLTDHGVELQDAYVGPEGVLTGSMRQAQEAREAAAALSRQQEIDRRRRELDRKRRILDAEITAQRAQLEAEQEEMKLLISQDESVLQQLREDREAMRRGRQAGGELGKRKGSPVRETNRGGDA
jgi:circadian clock protein KaiC